VNDDPIELSTVGLSADPVARKALVGRIVAQYLARGRRLTIWRGIIDYGRPAIALAAALLIGAVLSVTPVRRQTIGRESIVDTGPRVPPAIARWMASPTTPGALEVMLAMAETPR
jgi:hypothetical protein